MNHVRENIEINGDILLILTPATEPFPWDEDYLDPCTGHDSSPAANTQRPEPGSTVNGTAKNQVKPPIKFEFRVSSKYLSLGSLVFATILNGCWRESTKIYADGLRHIFLADFDPEALSILLHVMHFRRGQAPRYVGMETMAQIALLVDYLECNALVANAVTGWMPRKPYCMNHREAALWIFISSVLNHKTVFKEATRTAVINGDGPFQTLGLPIQKSTVDRIDAARTTVLRTCLGALNRLVISLTEGPNACSFMCDSLMLGALIKNLHSHQLLCPRPAENLEGLSVAKLQRMIESFKNPIWWAAEWISSSDAPSSSQKNNEPPQPRRRGLREAMQEQKHIGIAPTMRRLFEAPPGLSHNQLAHQSCTLRFFTSQVLRNIHSFRGLEIERESRSDMGIR